jgi:pSer/pThr/pTyr-binding forkhead associated (FHA) protein
VSREKSQGIAIAVVELHPVRGRRRGLADGAVIGRALECDVRLDDPLVSRRHALVVADPGGPRIEDLGSSNGLYVNGSRTRQPVTLEVGDVVQLGATVWRVVAP